MEPCNADSDSTLQGAQLKRAASTQKEKIAEAEQALQLRVSVRKLFSMADKQDKVNFFVTECMLEKVILCACY
jgi:CHAD domain-containing protein